MSLGIEWAARYVLDLPGVQRAVFNDSTDADYVGALSPESSGLDSPEVREDAQDATEADGGIHGNFFYGRRPVILQGTILATNATDRNTKVGKLLRASNAMRTDAILRWKPLGAPDEVFVSLRRQQPPRVTKGFVKDFLLPMVSADARIYSMTLTSASATGLLGGPSAFKFPLTAAQGVHEAGEGGVWANPNNILTTNNVFATVTGNEGWSGLLIGRNFGFTVPNTATITGVEAQIERRRGASTCKDKTVTLVKENTVPFGSNKASSETWPTPIDVIKFYGGATDMWGLTTATLTPAIVNSTGFGLGVAIGYVNAAETTAYSGEVDTMVLKVYWKNPPIAMTVTNDGDTDSPPTIKITGPATNFTVKNVTTGKSIKIDHALGAGSVVTIDFKNRTIKGSTGNNLYSKLDFINSDWWELEPGENKIEVTTESAETSSTKVETSFRDAWL